MTMKYKWTHECEKPDMAIGIETFETGKWWWKKTGSITVYEKRQVEFICDVCGSSWTWLGAVSGYRGYWTCTKRTSEWRDYP